MKHRPGAFAVELLPAAAYAARDAAHLATLGVALERQRGVHALGSDRRVDFDTWAGTAALTPPGMDVYSESPEGGEYLVLRWVPADGDLPLPPARVQRTGQAALLRPALRVRAALLAARADAGDALDAAVQSLLAAGGALLAPARRGADAGRLQARYAPLLQRIEDALPEGASALSLATLAAAVGESPLRLLRGFSRATGMTPHAYIAERRLQRARRLVQATRLPLADIAADCGYASQSHMGLAFTRQLGVSPARWRARTSR